MSDLDISFLRCPLHGDPLRQEGDRLVSTRGERYPVVQGVPVLLAKTADPTLWVLKASYEAARNNPGDPYHEDTIGYTPDELADLKKTLECKRPDDVDPIVSYIIGATSGYLYRDLIGSLPEIPIPELRLPAGNGRLLDIGCNWGRWSIAAARKGYKVVGVDPSLGAVLAANRLAKRLGVDATFVVGDALRLPFAQQTFDRIFSYSVLQHFSRENCDVAIRQAARVSKDDGILLIQMPNVFGIRSFYHLARRKFSKGSAFDVRYYTPWQLRRIFARSYGRSHLSVDGFFGLGIQPTDRHLFSTSKRLVVDASEMLRVTAQRVPALTYIADSLYVTAYRQPSALAN